MLSVKKINYSLDQISIVWRIKQKFDINLSFITHTRHIPAWFHIFWATAYSTWKSISGSDQYVMTRNRTIYKKSRAVIFHPSSQKAPLIQFLQNTIWGHTSRTYIQNFISIKGFWFCDGSNFAISHGKVWSLLTRTVLLCSLWCVWRVFWVTHFIKYFTLTTHYTLSQLKCHQNSNPLNNWNLNTIKCPFNHV